jgi:hypothetical protein
MPKKHNIDEGDEVTVRGKVRDVEGHILRVKFPGYPYPISVFEDDVIEVFKAPKPRPPRDRSD